MQEELKTNLKVSRKKQGYSQETVARMSGISTRTYGLIEAGRSNPQFLTMFRICKSLDMSMNDIVKDNHHNRSFVDFLGMRYRQNPNYKIYATENNVRKIRKNLRLTQRTVAEMSQMSCQAFESVDRGYHLPELTNALKIAKALRSSVDRLFVLKEVPRETDY